MFELYCANKVYPSSSTPLFVPTSEPTVVLFVTSVPPSDSVNQPSDVQPLLAAVGKPSDVLPALDLLKLNVVAPA